MLSARRGYRRSLAAVCGGITLIVLALGYVGYGPFAFWSAAEMGVRDLLVRYGRMAETRNDLVFLAIDNATVTVDEVVDSDTESPLLRKIQTTGFPWPRDVYPVIIDRLLDAGAKVVALDLVFPSPREGDGVFRRTLEQHKDRVVLASNFESVEVALGNGTRSSMDQLFPPTPTLVLPGSDLESSVGFVNVWPDPWDGILRRVSLRRSALEEAGIASGTSSSVKVYHSLAARILQKAGAGDSIPSGTEPVLIRWASPSQDSRLEPSRRNFVPHSLYRIFVKDFWERNYGNGAFFKDKIVLIGPYGEWSKDIIQGTPVGAMAGPFFHLNVVNAVLNRDFIREAPRWVNVLLILFGGVLAWFLSTLIENSLLRLAGFVGFSALYWGGAQLAYNYFPGGGVLVLLLSPLVVLNLSGVVWFTFEQLVEQAERHRVRGIFERYVSRNVVREVLDNPQTFLQQLGGVRKECAILFTDLRGFTSRTEQGDSQQLVAQLNEYFDEMVKIVFDLNGTFDKCIGDAVMAVWGNIHSDGPKRDAEQALEAAIRMLEAVDRLNREWRTRGWTDFQIGAGLNQGEVIAGNMGGREKMEVTVIGDAVNLASRLESATKEYGVDILIGEKAGERLGDAFHLQDVDLVQLVGKATPIRVFTVLGSKTKPLSAETGAYLSAHEAGLALYRAGKFAEARERFLETQSIRRESKLAALYVRRCDQFIATPPKPGWDAVHVMSKK